MSEEEHTTVDLGDDLLVPQEKQAGASAEPSVQDEFERGRILMNEQLYEDAKKSLRKVLFREPNHPEASALLDQIAKLELERLLVGKTEKPRFKQEQTLSAEQVLERLDQDLKLGLNQKDPKVIPDLFSGTIEYQAFIDRVMKTVLPLPPRERVDLGVGFLEMGLNEAAISVFETVVRYEDYAKMGTWLLCVGLISAGRAIEATLKLEPLVRDITITEAEKVDFLYLLGRAFESMGDLSRAKSFYERVFILNSKYRDVGERLR